VSHRALPILTCLIAIAALGIHLIPGAAAALQLDRDAVGEGEVWRAFTCHLTHVDTGHLVWNLAMFLALGFWLERRHPGRFRFVLAVAGFAIAPVIVLTMPDLDLYRGLSGIDSALFAWLAFDLIRAGLRERRPGAIVMPALLAAGFVLKVALEAAYGATLFVDSSASAMVPVPLAHVVGGLAGLVAS